MKYTFDIVLHRDTTDFIFKLGIVLNMTKLNSVITV